MAGCGHYLEVKAEYDNNNDNINNNDNNNSINNNKKYDIII